MKNPAILLIGAGATWILARPLVYLTFRIASRLGAPLVAVGVLGYVVGSVQKPARTEERNKK